MWCNHFSMQNNIFKQNCKRLHTHSNCIKFFPLIERPENNDGGQHCHQLHSIEWQSWYRCYSPTPEIISGTYQKCPRKGPQNEHVSVAYDIEFFSKLIKWKNTLNSVHGKLICHKCRSSTSNLTIHLNKFLKIAWKNQHIPYKIH